MEEHKRPKNKSGKDQEERRATESEESILEIIIDYEESTGEESWETEKGTSSSEGSDENRSERTRSRGPKSHHDNDDE